MFKAMMFRLLICFAIAMSGALFGIHTAYARQGGGGGSYSGGGGGCSSGNNGGSTSTSDQNYQTIIDFTQASSLNTLVTNIASSLSTRDQPHIGANPAPYAGIDPGLIPNTYTNFPSGSNSDMYVRVEIDQCDLTNTSLASATQNTCNQSDPSQCPSGSVLPKTFVHRLGTYNTGTGVVNPLPNTAIGHESLNSMFKLNGQAFDMDRLRYVANRLWYQWYQDVKSNVSGTPRTGDWANAFTYQPTGTMSFENFIHNVVKGYSMYGIVRVMVPVDSSGNVYYNPKQPVGGAEFQSGAYVYNKSDDKNYSGANGLYTFEELDTQDGRSGSAGNAQSKNSGIIKVYGMLLFDFIDVSTYNPDDFLSRGQDYVDRYASVSAHDSTSTTATTPGTGVPRVNVIEGATVSRNNIALWDWDTLDINSVDDLQTQVQYTDTAISGSDGRADSLDIIRRKYMMAGTTNNKQFNPGEVSDAYVWEYWMRQAANDSSTVRAQILSQLAAQYDIQTQTFTDVTGLRNTFNTTVWSGLPEKDKFHAYFPNAYERGWIIAFAKLGMATLDQTTASKTVGSWWSALPQNTTDANSNNVGGGYHSGRTAPYPDFSVPTETLDVDYTQAGGANPVNMPNFFSTGWEDLPALAFAGGLLDVHGFMNVSGMMYTPDSCELETHSASGEPSKPAGTGAFEYVNGAILAGDGFWLEDQDTSDHSLIAISYNYNSFDQIRSGSSNVTIMKVNNIAEIKN